MFIQEAAAIVAIEYSCKAPWLLLERLNVLDFYKQYIAWLGRLDVEGTREVVNLREIDVLHIIRRIIILDLPPSPIEAFDLDNFVVLDLVVCRNWSQGACLVGRSL